MDPVSLLTLAAGGAVLLGLFAAWHVLGPSGSARNPKTKRGGMASLQDPTGDPMNRPPKLTESPREWSLRVGIPLSRVQALIAVESAGKANTELGPIIRVENHHLIKRVADAVKAGQAPQRLLDEVKNHFRVLGPETWLGHQWREAPDKPWKDSHIEIKTAAQMPLNQQNEYAAFRKAWSLLTPHNLEDIVFKSMSWGVGQQMGRYYYPLGYRNAEEMYNDARDGGRRVQEQQMLAFIERVKPALLSALQRGDWVTVGHLYNGAKPGTAWNTNYVKKFTAKEAEFRQNPNKTS